MTPLKLAVFVSGGGTTLANLIERIRDGRLQNVRIVGVVSSRATARAVEIARAANLPLEIIRRRDFAGDEAYSAALAAAADRFGAELVALAGFLCRWIMPSRYVGRVINIHPALLPRFGGQGMFGRHVHQAVLAAGDRESGCTVHVADEQYDHGPIVAQARVPVITGDTPESLAARVAAAESELYPQVIGEIAASSRRLPLVGGVGTL